MKKFSKKIIFIISFLLIISISSTSYSIANINMESIPKIKATTYFGDEWPMSFWSREYINEERNFERIKNDGFNTIILCIPWREVQPSFYDDFNHDVIKRIEYIIDLADKKDLKVMVRLGYTWDLDGDDSPHTRFKQVWTQDVVRKAWHKYADKMYQILSSHKNFIGGFISWEDFWDGLINTYSNFDDIDKALLKLLVETQEVFPCLSMECRLFEDPLDNGGTYSHKSTFGCGDADYSSLLLSIGMGNEYYKTLKTENAVRTSEGLIDKFSICGKPIFIDQFLYTETTPGYEFLSEAENINEYLKGMAKVFNKKTIGYGLWTSQDYVDNIIYNPEFGIGKTRWMCEGTTHVDNVSGNNMMYIGNNSKISQDLSWKGFIGKTNAKLKMTVISNNETDIKVGLSNDQIKTIHIKPGIQEITEEFENKNLKKFSIETKNGLYVDNIKLYSVIISGGIYDINGRAGDNLSGIRAMNQIMK